jgi:tetratricopeptide (TPR) repeat protein
MQEERETVEIEKEIEGKTAEDLLLVGEEYLAEGRFEDAIKVYKEIVKKEPGLPTTAKACNDCGVAYASLEQYEMATGFFNAALNLKQYLMDEGISAYYNLGQVYKIAGDDEKAKEYFRRGDTLKQEHKHRDEEVRRSFSSFME